MVAMNYWMLTAVCAALGLAAVFAYAAIRWRPAPAAFRAMNWVAGVSFSAGVALGIAGFQLFALQSPGGEASHEAARSAVPGTTAPDAKGCIPAPAAKASIAPTGPAMSAEVRCGIPVAEVKDAAVSWVPNECRGAGFLASWSDYDELCRLGHADSRSLCCRAAHLIVLGRFEVTPASYEEVASFCVAGFLQKESGTCRVAQHFAHGTHPPVP